MRKRPNKAGSRVMILFSLPFAGTGCFMLWLILSSLVKQSEMAHWPQADADIVHSKLIRSSDSDGGSTYKTEVLYEYTVQGIRYQSDALGLYSQSDNIGDYWKDWNRKLNLMRQQEKQIPAYYEPGNPANAVLDRKVRKGMLLFFSMFALVFGGAGFAMLIAALRSQGKEKESKRLHDENPDEPWNWNEDWASGAIQSKTKTGLVAVSIFALVWNLVTWAAAIPIYEEWQDGEKAAAFFLIFPVVGLVLLVVTGYHYLRFRRYGVTTLHLVTPTGVLGGKLTGAISVPEALDPQDGFEVQLANKRQLTTGSGKNRSTTTRVLWEDVQRVQRGNQGDPSQSLIPVVFDVPYDASETNRFDNSDGIYWEVRVKAEVPGIDYAAQFEVPVFKTEDSDPDFVPEPHARLSHGSEDEARELEEQGIELFDGGSGNVEIYFRAARNKGSAVALTLFALAWSAICFFLMRSDAPLLFRLSFVFADLFVIYGALWLWFHTIRIRTRNHRISIHKGGFGLSRSSDFALDECEAFNTTTGMTSNNKAYYDVKLLLRNGKKVTCGSSIQSRHIADHLTGRLNRLLDPEA